MSAVDHLIHQIQDLPPEEQQALLSRLQEHSAERPVGRRGADMLVGVGLLDSASAREMIEAIELDCERVDASDW